MMIFGFYSVVQTTPTQVLQPQHSLLSLQPTRKKQIMIPDDSGILRPRHCRPDTVKYIQHVVDAEERMDAMSQRLGSQVQSTQTLAMIPFTPPTTASFASLTSTTSVASATSSGSQMSTRQQR